MIYSNYVYGVFGKQGRAKKYRLLHRRIFVSSEKNVFAPAAFELKKDANKFADENKKYLKVKVRRIILPD